MWLKLPESAGYGEPPMPDDAFYFLGHDQQIVAIVPSRDLVIVRLGLTQAGGDWDHARDLAPIVRPFRRRLAEPQATYLNSASDSLASTPPVSAMSANGVLAAISASVTMIWPILVASSAIEAPNTTREMPHHTMAPMHIGQDSPEVYSVVPFSFSGPCSGEEVPDRHHLAVSGRVLLLFAEIAAAGQHRAVAHDHRAERVVAERRLFQREPHEAQIGLGRRRLEASAERRGGQRQRQRAEGARDHVAPADR